MAFTGTVGPDHDLRVLDHRTWQLPERHVEDLDLVRSGVHARVAGAAAIGLARNESRSTLVVATAAADVDNLRFYSRTGFRMHSIEPDAFTAATGYDPETSVDGIKLLDRVGFTSASLARLRAPPRSRVGLARPCAA